jgi:hypothetical protein
MAQMLAYLADFDAAAVDHLEANRALFQSLFTPDALARFQARVEAFAFEEAQAQLAAALDCLPAETAVSAPASAPRDEIAAESYDEVQARAAVERLHTYLAEFDPTAVDYLDAQSPVLRALFPPGAFAEFHHNVETYAFGEALAQLDAVTPRGEVVPFSDQTFPAAPAAGDSPSAQQTVAQMRQYLADYDVAAVDHLAAHRELFRARFAPEAFAEFERRIASFAFGEAQAQLEEATDSHAN